MATLASTPRQEILSFAEIRRLMGLSRERMGRLLDVSAKTVERWEARNELPSNRLLRDRLAQIQEIAQLGLMVYTREGFDLFMTTPMGVFDGHTALQYIEIGRGDEVFSALAEDYEGMGF
jgi:DNA-binding XRE family transcriptional regulator